MYFLIFMGVVAWLSLGIVCYNATNDLVEIRLEDISLPARWLIILTAPLALLVYERHLFYRKAEKNRP